ncbi:hypothetical protein [Kitasatospora griseola]
MYPNRTAPVSRPFYPFQTLALQAGPANAPGSRYLTDYHASRYTRQGSRIGTVSAGNPNLPDDLWTFHDAGGVRFWVTNPGHDGHLQRPGSRGVERDRPARPARNPPEDDD